MSKYFKLPKSKEIIEVTDTNTEILYIRAGFVECDKTGKSIKEKE